MALAYADSATFRDSLAIVRRQHERAKTRGHQKTMRQIEAEMQARQERLHGQTLGTAPVNDILASYPGDLAELGRAHGACVIVSKWDLVWQDEEARLVDLTDVMVQPYDLDERTLEEIGELRKVDPVPLVDLRKGSDH